MVEARSLRKALNARFATQADLHLFAPAEGAVERSEDGVRVRLPDGSAIQCQLVIAAEGRNSPLRDQAGIQVTRIPYHQTAIVCAIAHERPHHDMALEHFLPAGPFAVLPMGPSADAEPGGSPHVSAIVWTEKTADATLSWRWTTSGSRARPDAGWVRTWVRSARSGDAGAIRCRP